MNTNVLPYKRTSFLSQIFVFKIQLFKSLRLKSLARGSCQHFRPTKQVGIYHIDMYRQKYPGPNSLITVGLKCLIGHAEASARQKILPSSPPERKVTQTKNLCSLHMIK